MVEECCKYVNQTPDLDTKLKLIDTLITVSKGKVQSGLYLACNTSANVEHCGVSLSKPCRVASFG